MITALHPEWHGEVVLLWDVDNMPGGRRQLLSLARALSAAVPADSRRVAAARRVTYRRFQDALADMGFEVVSGGTSASGADRHLYDRARAYRRRARQHSRLQQFYVVSNDKYFARVSSLGDLHVITLDRPHISARLAKAATTITELEFDGSEWRVNDAQHSGAPSASQTQPLT